MNPIFRAALVLAFPALAAALHAAPPERAFQPASWGKSRLVYAGEVPVLHLYGTPARMGEAAGRLTGKVLRRLAPDFARRFMDIFFALIPADRKKAKEKKLLDLVRRSKAGIPKDRMKEIEALARAAGVPEEQILLANLLPEVAPRVHCSTLFLAGTRMTDEAPALGRNLDYPPIADIHLYGLVVVYHEKGRIPLASLTFPGLVGVLSGMNEKGLCGATMDVYRDARKAYPGSLPRFLFYREVLSRNATVDQVLRAARGVHCLSGGNFMVADAAGRAAVLESDGKKWAFRRPQGGALFATNFFRSPSLGGPHPCRRYSLLEKQVQRRKVFSPRILKGVLRMAALGPINVQCMVFRPASREIDFAFGRIPAAASPFHRLVRKDLFGALQSPPASRPFSGSPGGRVP